MHSLFFVELVMIGEIKHHCFLQEKRKTPDPLSNCWRKHTEPSYPWGHQQMTSLTHTRTHTQAVLWQSQMCGSEFPAVTTPVSLQNTELISCELYTLSNINLHTAQESIMTGDSSYQHNVHLAFTPSSMLCVVLTLCWLTLSSREKTDRAVAHWQSGEVNNLLCRRLLNLPVVLDRWGHTSPDSCLNRDGAGYGALKDGLPHCRGFSNPVQC